MNDGDIDIVAVGLVDIDAHIAVFKAYAERGYCLVGFAVDIGHFDGDKVIKAGLSCEID